jgi:transposase
MGRSCGGLTTKIHAVVDANGNPITLKLSEGQAHDGRSAVDLLDTVQTGQILLADRGYDSDALRKTMAERGGVGQHQAHAEPGERAVIQSVALSLPQSGRALLQQAQAFQGHRHALRETRRQLPWPRQTRRRQNLDEVYESVT